MPVPQEKKSLDHDELAVPKLSKIAHPDLALAVQTSANSKISWTILFGCFVTFLCACVNGFDGSLMTGINAMPFYQSYFQTGTTGSKTSLVFSLYSVGNIAASFFAGPLSDRYGRRVGMFVGAVFIVLGASLACAAQSLAMLYGARFVLGFGVSILTCAAPACEMMNDSMIVAKFYPDCVEISPPQYRGRMTGLYNVGYFGGAIPAACLTFGTNYMRSNASWRIPLGLQCVPCGVVLLTVFFLPESPRWLLAHGRETEARSFLVHYHANGDESNPLVDLQWKEFREQISVDGSDKRWWDYRGLFMTRNARWRSLMIILMAVFGQFSGNGLGYFSTVIYQNLGFTQSAQQLGLNLGNQVLSAVGALTAAALSDRMRRRPVLIYGTLTTAALLAINGALSDVYGRGVKDGRPNNTIGSASTAFYFLFNFAFAFTYTPLQVLYPAECLQTECRAKGLAMYTLLLNCIGFINQYAGPIALKNIQNNYIWIFVAWDTVESAIWALCAVETQGRTLEELDEVFAEQYPPRALRQEKASNVKYKIRRKSVSKGVEGL